jgi:hypothetical protein
MPSRQEAREAIAQAKEVAEQDQEILGPNHPETLQSQLKLAKALVEGGESRSATTLLGKLLPVVRAELGDTSRETLRVEEVLAPLQRSAGALHIVKTRQEILLTAVTRDWGEDSDITFWVMRELAKTLLDLGSIGDADVLLQTTLDRCLQVHGDRHMETLRTLAWLANAKRKAGDYQQAQLLDAEALQCAAAMEVDIRLILDTKRHLIIDAAGMQQWMEVLKLGEEIVNEARARLPADDDLRVSIERQQKLVRLLTKNAGPDSRRFKQLKKILEDPAKSQQFNQRLRRKMRKEDLPDF